MRGYGALSIFLEVKLRKESSPFPCPCRHALTPRVKHDSGFLLGTLLVVGRNLASYWHQYRAAACRVCICPLALRHCHHRGLALVTYKFVPSAKGEGRKQHLISLVPVLHLLNLPCRCCRCRSGWQSRSRYECPLALVCSVEFDVKKKFREVVKNREKLEHRRKSVAGNSS